MVSAFSVEGVFLRARTLGSGVDPHKYWSWYNLSYSKFMPQSSALYNGSDDLHFICVATLTDDTYEV